MVETTSLKTKKKDTVDKLELYARLGIREYFLHDPTGEYLDPPLQGYRLRDGNYERIPAEATSSLYSEELNMRLLVEDGELNLYHPDSTERILTNEELAASEAEGRNREAEARQLAEAEVERLRAELAKYQSGQM